MKKNITVIAIFVVYLLLVGNASAAFIPIGDDDTPFTYNDIPFEYGGVELDVYKTSDGFVPSESIDLSGYITEKIHIIETASWATNVPDGVVVGHIKVHYIDGSSDTLDLVMGVNIAEWAYDRLENQTYLNHTKVPPAYSYWTNIDSDYYYWGHCFYVQITTQQKTLDNLELILDPTSYTGQPDTGYAPADWFGITISAITLEVSDGPVINDDLDIERIYMSYSKDYLDGTAVTNPWFFMAMIDFADTGNLASIKMTLPDGVTTYSLDNENGTWEYRSWPTVYPTLTAVRTDFPEGIYTFDFRDNSGLLIKSIQLDYSGLAEPGGPVDFTYPSYNGQTDISTNPTFTWTVDSGAGDILVVSLDDYSEIPAPIFVPMDTLSWQPGPLDPEQDYRLYVDILRIKDWTGGPGFPTETVDDDTFEYVLDIGCHNDITFTTAALSADPIEEILDFIDDSVGDGTLTGEGPGNSADNRLNALRNKLEEAQSLIEAGSLEEACDKLWSTYRKCDGELRPPDFVAGEAAEDLANMILWLMNELGCD